MPEYYVDTPIKLPSGEIIMSGRITLEGDEADAAVKAGAVLLSDNAQAEDEAGDEEEISGSDELAEVVEAIAVLSTDDPGNWTATGRPALPVLEDALGRRITAAVRDAAWAIFLQRGQAD